MPKLDRSDISLHYEVTGDGPPILLLAGMLSDSASWGPLVPLLEPNFTVIRPDNRTTGRTTPWDASVTVQHMAQDAAALMEHLGHDRFHVAGHSMGGLMATEVAGLIPHGVQTLTILASAPVRVPRTMAVFDTLREIRHAPDGERLWLLALYPWIFRPAFFADPSNTDIALQAALNYPHAQSLSAMAHQIEALRGYRPTARLNEIRCSTKIVFAEHDLLIPESLGREAYAHIASVEQVTLPDAGHSIHWDAPDSVADHVIEFVGQNPIEGT